MRGFAIGSWVVSLGLAGVVAGEDIPVTSPSVEQAEAKENAPAAAPNQQIRLKIQIVEVSRSALRQQGIDFSAAFDGHQQQDRQAAAELIAMLSRLKVLKVLAEPTLVTVNGRQASFQSGPTVSGRKIGTDVKVKATMVDTARVRIELHAVQTDVDPFSSVVTRRGTIPGFKMRAIDTEVGIDLGNSAFCGGGVQTEMQTVVDSKTRRKSSVAVETQTLFFVTPELITPDAN